MALQIQVKTKKDLQASVSVLLGRIITTCVIPITEDQQDEFWFGFFEPEVVMAFKLLQEKEYQVYGLLRANPQVEFELENKSYRMTVGHSCLANLAPIPKLSEAGLERRWKCGEEKLTEFKEWAIVTSSLFAEFRGALKTIFQVMEICSTLGQLNRAIPELAKYLTGDLQEQLRRQKHASAMPYEWAPFDKVAVEAARNALAKAHLMRQGERMDLMGSKNPFTWVNFC